MNIAAAVIVGLTVASFLFTVIAICFVPGFFRTFLQKVSRPLGAALVFGIAILFMGAVTQISLTTQVSGILPTANGGTGSNSASTGSGGVVLATSPAISSPTLTTPGFSGAITTNEDLGTAEAVVLDVSNAGTTGTTVNKLAKCTGAPCTAVIAATTDTSGELGIVVSGAGTSGSAQIAMTGWASAIFDGATTAGDYVQISSTTAGDVHDSGSTYPTSGQVLGRVFSTNGSGGTFAVFLFGNGIQGSNTTVINFADNETPSGSINSSNVTFTLAHTPNPTASLSCYENGVEQIAGGADYTLSTGTITYGVAPPTGTALRCTYRY